MNWTPHPCQALRHCLFSRMPRFPVSSTSWVPTRPSRSSFQDVPSRVSTSTMATCQKTRSPVSHNRLATSPFWERSHLHSLYPSSNRLQGIFPPWPTSASWRHFIHVSLKPSDDVRLLLRFFPAELTTFRYRPSMNKSRLF